MSTREYQPAKIFTVEEANQCLPLVRAITADLVQLSNDVLERRQRLALLMAGRQPDAADPYSQELAEVERQIERDALRLREYIQELVELGVEPKSALDGLVDFPALIDGRLVFLCWRLGEPEVLHWHDLEAGFAGRQALPAGTMA